MKKAIVIFYKDLKQYYMKAPVISWGILFPISMIVLISLGMRVYGESRMVPAMFSISLLFASTSMAQVSVSFEKMSGSFYRLLFLPVTVDEILLGKLLGGFLYGFIGTAIAATSMYIVTGEVLVIKPMYLALGILLGSAIFSLTSIMITLLLEPIPGVAVLNIIRFSMIFLGGVIFPSVLYPYPYRYIVYLFPSLYVNEMIRYGLYNEWDYIDPYTSTFMLFIVLLALTLITRRLVKYVVYS